jgi:ubiquinone/menaquinone biosynthesis C-methylase UbiE
MQKLFSLGEMYVSDFLAEGEIPRCEKVDMTLLYDANSGAVRLEKSAPLDAMYGKYWYRSGINSTMKQELHSIVQSINHVMKLNSGDVWLDIACNDGTLFTYVSNDLIKVGVDPVDDSYKVESEKIANVIIQDYFTAKAYKESQYGDKKAKVVTTIAMFYDLEKPEVFLKDVYDVIDDDGLFVLQMSYTPLMLEQMAFDNICHEHIYYYTLKTIYDLFEANGFKIVDCQLNDVNGGSFRVYAMKDVADVTKFATQPYRDVCNFRVQSLLSYENQRGYNSTEIWDTFYKNLLNLKKDVYNFIVEKKAEGKTIWGYGASTKGNTLLQYFGLDNTLIDGIAERSPYKFGLRTVGTNIPIYSEEDMRKVNPDYLLVLPWHFINEFKQRERQYLENGGKFIVPCPKFIIIGE